MGLLQINNPKPAPWHHEQISLTVNGESQTITVPVHWTLLEVVRYRLHLTGSKQGCDKGDCGACTMLVDGQPVLSCLTLATEADGATVLTIEGIGTSSKPHPIQDAMDITGGSQCGFCNPGIMMAALPLIEQKERITRRQAAECISGNLCRCTGYTKIIDAIVLANEMLQKKQGKKGDE